MNSPINTLPSGDSEVCSPANPGSPLAVANGCTCPVLDNGHGKGSGWGEGCFWRDAACPIHGVRLDTELRDAYEITDQLSGPNDMEAI